MVTVLIENTMDNVAGNVMGNIELTAEHGLSLFIEFNDRKILLDAGTSGAFMKNAEAMKVDVSEADYVVLSHGHYDHAGGFMSYLKVNKDKKLYSMKSAINDYYSGSGGSIHEIGIPRDILNKYMDNFILIDSVTELDDGIYLLPHGTEGLQKIGEKARLYKLIKDELVADDFSHELSLIVDTEKGLVVFNSCSHAGIVNIMEEVKEVFPNKSVYSFFGGLHMKGKRGDEVICTFSEEEIKDISDYLNESGLQKLYTGHCTGEPAIRLLKKYLGDKVDILSTGRKICI